ncbi:MAG: TIGR01777 family oxidoreductase [Terriglobales bacterium]
MGQTVLISGANGLIGSAVASALKADGWTVKRLVRRATSAADEIQWEPTRGADTSAVEGADAVVHLAGEPVFGRWTAEKMQRIRNSRTMGTAALANALAQCERKPRVMVSASAVGYYGDRGGELLTEDSSPGKGFLAETAVAWERAAEAAKHAGIRVVHLRTGIVLSRAGGALKTMLPAFKLGIAGRLGSGTQYFPWVTLVDMVRVVKFALANESLSGAVNVVAPKVVSNFTFTETLAKVVGPPAFIPVPEFLLKLLPGNMAQEAILASARVRPQRLLEKGFKFTYPELEPALKAIMENKA